MGGEALFRGLMRRGGCLYGLLFLRTEQEEEEAAAAEQEGRGEVGWCGGEEVGFLWHRVRPVY